MKDEVRPFGFVDGKDTVNIATDENPHSRAHLSREREHEYTPTKSRRMIDSYYFGVSKKCNGVFGERSKFQ